MKRFKDFFIFCFLTFCLFSVSCVSLSKAETETETVPYLYYLDREEAYIFTSADQKIISSVIGTDNIKFERISACIDPLSNKINGVLEGNFSKKLVNSVLSLNAQFKKEQTDNKEKYFVHSQSGLKIFVFKKGVILFTDSDLIEFVETIKMSQTFDLTAESEYFIKTLLENKTGFYVKKPKVLPDSEFFEDIDKFDCLFFYTDSEENNTPWNIEIKMKNEDISKSLFTVLKANYISNLREQGLVPDLSELKRKFLIEGPIIYLKNYKLESFNLYNILPGIQQLH